LEAFSEPQKKSVNGEVLARFSVSRAQVIEKKAAGPVSRILRAALQRRKLLDRRERTSSIVAMMSGLAGFTSHLCHRS
jgi:hypothetical protein